MRAPGDRTMIRLPEECKEYLAIYTTEYDDSYVLETIVADDIVSLRQAVSGQKERVMEAEFNYDVEDTSSTILETERIVKIRKLNKKIGDNLKLLYGYRCQICGQLIGEEYGSHIVEAHHIDYFVSSLNNDASNQLIVDSVINTGKSIMRIIDELKNHNPGIDVIIAANVIQNEAVELFKDYLVFATRLSKNSFVGVNQSKQTGKTGPDTADRLFNLIKKRY